VRDFDSSLLRRDFDRSAEENRDRETALRFLDLSVVLFSLHVETISIFLDSRADSRHLIEPFLEGYFEELDETGLQALVSACRKKSFASKFARLNGGEPRFGFKAEPLNRLRLSVSDETFGGLAERLRALQAPAAPLVSEGDLLAPHPVSAISA
jgi:hypothetical protein